MGVTVLDKPCSRIMGKVHHSRSYICYLCGFMAEMQVTFVQNFTQQHPGQPFHCDFCKASFQTCNGLFKYERLHQYLKYTCNLCGHKTQFPYQMRSHYKVHSDLDLEKCELCEHSFACKSSCVAHQKSDTTKITCDKCPSGKSKVYTSQNSFHLHLRGKHGPGWTAPCGKHCGWKSQFTCHVKRECANCTKLMLKAMEQRYPFLKKIKKERK